MAPPNPTGSAPVRLKVTYKTPQALLTEFTRSVGKGTVTIESKTPVEIGTHFVFELRAQGVEPAVEVRGEVVQVTPAGEAKFLLTIRYDPGDNRDGLDALLGRVFEAHRHEKIRKHPRIPIQLRATEETAYSPSYVVRDISRGGVGVEVEAPKAPPRVSLSAPFLLEVSLSLGNLALHGEVVWIAAPPAEAVRLLNPTFGVSFGKLHGDTEEGLKKILSLRGLPPPPWRARISFGMDAVARMP